MRLVTALIVGLILGPTSGQTTKRAPLGPRLKDGAPKNVTAYFNRAMEMKASELMDLQELSQRIQRAKINTRLKKMDMGDGVKPIVFTSVAEKQAMLKATNDRIQMYSDPTFVPAAPIGPLEVGAIGALREKDPVVVRQIIDGQNMLVQIYFLIGPNDSFTGRLCWLTASTNGLVDGDRLTIGKLVEITGTRTYETSTGSNTTYVIRPFDLSKYIEP